MKKELSEKLEELRSQKLDNKQIAEKLNAEGIKTPKNGVWTSKNVANMLYKSKSKSKPDSKPAKKRIKISLEQRIMALETSLKALTEKVDNMKPHEHSVVHTV